jgi:acetyl/propionyl-CoA carboxylase alpha subunit
MTSSVWKVLVEAGDKVEQGQTLVILEAMKMEIRKSGFRIISTRDRHHRAKPDDPVFLPSLIVTVAAIRADETMDGSTVVKVVAKPGSLMDPGQTLVLLSSRSSE